MGHQISVRVNGRTYEREVEARLLLVHFLRDELGLTGTNVGCETSLLRRLHGADRRRRSQGLYPQLAVQADGSSITTIEGLASNGDLHPLQAAFREEHALQCGYCTPGMILSAVDLLERNTEPSEDEIREGLKGNVCRCTGYHNIVKAVRRAAGGAS